jgi:hypothetical protein
MSAEMTEAAVQTDPATAPAPTSRSVRVRNLVRRIRDASLTTAGVRPSELVTVVLLLALLGLAAYGGYIRHSGFIQDDWSDHAAWMIRTDGGHFSHFWHFVALFGHDRPALGIYLGLTDAALGFHQHMYVALALATAILLSASFYLLLRTLRFAPVHAAVIAGLVLIFPAADSLRLWSIMGDGSWALALLVLGAVLTLWSFEATGRRAWALRAGGLALYAASLLTYEIGVFVVATSVVLYRCAVPWRRAALAWAQDVVLAVVIYVLAIRPADSAYTGSAGSTLHRARDIAAHAFKLVGTQVLPLHIGEAAVLVLAGLVIAAAALAVRRLDADDPARAGIRRWLITIGVASVVVIAAYAVYAGAGDYAYDPLDPGTGNRTNALAALPLATIAYALGALLCLLLSRVPSERMRSTPARRWLAIGPVVLGLALAVSYFVTTHKHADKWATGYRQAFDTLQLMHERMPAPPPGSMVISFGQPIWESNGIPIFAASWDLNGAVQATYHDYTLAALPAFPGTTIACGRNSAGPVDPTFAAYTSAYSRPYGKLYLFSSDGRWAAPRSREQCRRLSRTFVPGPWFSSIQ